MSDTVVTELRLARRRRRLQRLDVGEALYRGYLTVLVGGVGVYALSNLPKDTRLHPGQIVSAAAHGPAIVGVVVAVLVGLAVRSGARGGPLLLEAPDIQHVLLAPVSRALALRQPALQRVRATLVGWGAVGAVAGLLASKRFPGHVAAWLASCIAAGLLTGTLIVGAGL